MLHSAFLLSLLAFQVEGMTLDEERAALARGQKYAEKVAAVWAAKLPQEHLLGQYFGRQWFGTLRISIKAAPAGSGAVYEVACRNDCKVFGNVLQTESRGLLDAKLWPVSAEFSETSPRGKNKRRLQVADGAWIVLEGDPPVPGDRKGKLSPGVSFEPAMFPLFARPDDDSALLLCGISNKGLNHFRRVAEPAVRMLEGKKQNCRVLKTSRGESNPDLWYFSEDGRPLEWRSEVEEGLPPQRFRPITEAAIGKPLAEPVELRPAERRVLDVFVAIKKNDGTALASCFDFERLTREAVPDYAAMTPADRKKAVATMRDNMVKGLLDEKMRASLGDVPLLEDGLAAAIKSEENGVASVTLYRAGTWSVAQATEGPRKGQWLVFKITQ